MLELDGLHQPASPPISLYQAPRKQRPKTLTGNHASSVSRPQASQLQIFYHGTRPTPVHDHDSMTRSGGRAPNQRRRRTPGPTVRQSLKCHNTPNAARWLRRRLSRSPFPTAISRAQKTLPAHVRNGAPRQAKRLHVTVSRSKSLSRALYHVSRRPHRPAFPALVCGGPLLPAPWSGLAFPRADAAAIIPRWISVRKLGVC